MNLRYRFYLILVLLILFALSSRGQSGVSRMSIGHITFGGSTPATCKPATGDVFFVNTGGSLGMYFCSATNTWTRLAGGATGTVNFSGIASGTNTTAAMLVGTGASINTTGNGTINASSLGGTIAASYAFWQKYTVTAIGNGVNGCENSSTSSAVFTGTGLDDATSGGTYTGTGSDTFTVIIDGTGTPDTFKWQKGAGAFTELVPITGAAQTLSDGVTITFAATTGHTATDQWVITVTDLGCWQVNGVLGADKEAGLTQDVTLFQLPANGFVTGARMKTATAFTGTTTATATLGTATNNDFFIVGAYDLKAAVSATNFSPVDGLLTAAGSTTAAAVNVVLAITTTVENINLIAAGASVDVWVFRSTLP